MTIGTFLKFEQNDGLKRELIGTGDAMIVEASPFDDRWGIGVGMTDLKKGKPWRGKNLLGKSGGCRAGAKSKTPKIFRVC